MKKNLSSILFIAIAIVVAGIMYFIFTKQKTISNEKIDVKTSTNFEKTNANLVKVDTFEMLVHKAYGAMAIVSKADGNLQVNMTEANQITKDFFNGNDALLKCKMDENDFEIKYSESPKSMNARFKIKDGGVNVPNDVMIKMMDKIYNSGKKEVKMKVKK
jgi:hypothetical protein